MFISQVQTHIHSLFITQDKTDTTADGDTSCSSVLYTHIYTLSLPSILKIIPTPQQVEIHHVHQSGTHRHPLFNTKDNRDATADGDTSCSSVGYKHTYNLYSILKIIPTPRQLEIHHVHQSGTNTQTLSLHYSR